MNVREARDSDADRIVDLVNQLGYSATSDLIHLKLNEFKTDHMMKFMWLKMMVR
jgi:hypothetical protein